MGHLDPLSSALSWQWEAGAMGLWGGTSWRSEPRLTCGGKCRMSRTWGGAGLAFESRALEAEGHGAVHQMEKSKRRGCRGARPHHEGLTGGGRS